MVKKIIVGCFCISSLPGLMSCDQGKQKQNATEQAATEPAAAKDIVPSKMVRIPGGTFQMGTNDPAFPDAQPIHPVHVKEFWMDEHEVTNAEFEKFVKATGYVTVAERKLDPKDYPGVPVKSLVQVQAFFPHPVNVLI